MYSVITPIQLCNDYFYQWKSRIGFFFSLLSPNGFVEDMIVIFVFNVNLLVGSDLG